MVAEVASIRENRIASYYLSSLTKFADSCSSPEIRNQGEERGKYWMRLRNYHQGDYSPGASLFVQLLWYFIGDSIVRSRVLPFSFVKIVVLRLFGATIGCRVRVKPGVRVKFPWRLSVGDDTWIGEDAWFDNLASITIGSNCCISQGAYFCTGDHDWSSDSFDLSTKPIVLKSHSWIAAHARVGPGVTVHEGAVLSLGSVATKDLAPWSIYRGNPARKSRSPRPRAQQVFNPDANKILLLNQAYYPDTCASAQYLTDLGSDLALHGFKVTALASNQKYKTDGPPLSHSEVHQGVTIQRVRSFHFAGSSKIVRLINALMVNLSFFIKLITIGRFDSVVVLTSPPLVSWVALIYSKVFGAKVYYWALDINPDQAIKAGFVAEKSLWAHFLEWSHTRVLAGVDGAIIPDSYMRDVLVSKGLSEDRSHIIPLWSDTENLQPVAPHQNTFRDAHNFQSKFIVMHSGNLSLCHPIATILEAAELLRDDDSTLFVFIGGGQRLSELLEYRSAHKLSNIIHLEYQPREQLSQSLSAADLHLVSMGEEYVGLVHPSKVYGILGVERPFVVVGTESGPLCDLQKELGSSAWVKEGDAQKLADIITERKNLPFQLNSLDRYRSVRLTYDKARVLSEFRTVIES